VFFVSADALPRRLDLRLNQGQYFRIIFKCFEMGHRTVKMRRRNVKRFAKFASFFFLWQCENIAFHHRGWSQAGPRRSVALAILGQSCAKEHKLTDISSVFLTEILTPKHA
jgi:hypothetical protein